MIITANWLICDDSFGDDCIRLGVICYKTMVTNWVMSMTSLGDDSDSSDDDAWQFG